MSSKQSKRARREAARRARQRRRLVGWGGAVAAVALAVVGLVFVGGSGDEAAAMAPDFALETLDGETLQLSDYRGRPVAVTFMHSF